MFHCNEFFLFVCLFVWFVWFDKKKKKRVKKGKANVINKEWNNFGGRIFSKKTKQNKKQNKTKYIKYNFLVKTATTKERKKMIERRICYFYCRTSSLVSPNIQYLNLIHSLIILFKKKKKKKKKPKKIGNSSSQFMKNIEFKYLITPPVTTDIIILSYLSLQLLLGCSLK